MLYMSSQSTNDGTYTLTVTFKHGVDLNMAQVLVQNRVNLAMPLLPDVMRQTGVTTAKRSPDILMAVSLISPDGRYDQLYLSNYALMQIRDELSRLPGVSDVLLFGQRDYSMRIWVDPDKLAARNLDARTTWSTPCASKTCTWPPARSASTADGPGSSVQMPLATLGPAHRRRSSSRTSSSRRTTDGRLMRIKDVARVELAPRAWTSASSVRHGRPSAWPSSSCPTPTPWIRPTASRTRWTS